MIHSLSDIDYQRLVTDASIIEKDSKGPKVLVLTDNRYLKVFRHKGQINEMLFCPLSKRFVDNIDKLRLYSILTPSIESLYRVEKFRIDIVIYQPLLGHSIRSLNEENQLPSYVCKQLGTYLAKLHDLGIYFRSAHLGNIILTPNGDLGLIDVADLTIERNSLSLWKRIRNIKHLLRSHRDKAVFSVCGLDNFVEAYLENISSQFSIKLLKYFIYKRYNKL